MTAEEWSKMRQIFIKNMTCAPIGVDELCCWCHVSAVDGQAILWSWNWFVKCEDILEYGCYACIKTVNSLNHMTT